MSDGTFNIRTYSDKILSSLISRLILILSGGGSVGGGNNIWSNPQDFAATAVAGTKTITFAGFTSTVLSSVIATLNFSAAVIKRVSATGAVDTLPLTNVAYAAGVLTLADMTANFVAGDTVLVFLPGPDKAYNQVYDVTQVAGPTADDLPVTAPGVRVSAKYVADIFASAVSASNNVAALVTDQFRRLHVRPAGYDSVGDGIRALIASSLAEPAYMDLSQTTSVAGGVSTDYYLDMDDFEYFSVQMYSTAGSYTKTVKFYMTDQDDGTAPASCNYNDVTNSWFGAASFVAAAAVASDALSPFERDTPLTCRYVKINVTVGAGANPADNQWVMYARKRRI